METVDTAAMQITQLARLSLAVVMNNRPVPKELTHNLFTQIQAKMEKANSNDTFMVCMAVGRGLGRKFSAEELPRLSNLIYNLYVQAATHMNAYDLY